MMSISVALYRLRNLKAFWALCADCKPNDRETYLGCSNPRALHEILKVPL